jgi:hypothetical protein
VPEVFEAGRRQLGVAGRQFPDQILALGFPRTARIFLVAADLFFLFAFSLACTAAGESGPELLFNGILGRCRPTAIPVREMQAHSRRDLNQ